MTLWHYCSSFDFHHQRPKYQCVCVCVCVCVCAQLWRSVQWNADSLSRSITVSHSVVFRPLCIWLWLDLLNAFIHYSLSLSLSLSLSPRMSSYNLPPSSLVRPQVCVWERGQQADTHYQQVQPVWWRSLRVRGWGGEELHGGFCQRYMSHCLWRNPSFRRERVFFPFFFFCPVWRTLSFERWEAWQLCSLLVFVSVICLFRCFLCHTAARCSPLSAQSFLMDTWRVRFFFFFFFF